MNRVYFYTGTGNSLRIAEKIAQQLQECEVVAITLNTDIVIPEGYDRIGFVFPVYFQGIPKILMDFLGNARFPKQGQTYYFSVATYGKLHGNALSWMDTLLNNKGIKLDYGKNLKMFSNYVVLYNMSRDIEKITEQSEVMGNYIASDINKKKTNTVSRGNSILNWYYKKQIRRLSKLDVHFSVSDSCISCGRCAEVCAARNIIMEDGKPKFQHHCNQCMGCIQFCPKKAINYKNITHNRRRYTHPKVNYKELVNHYK